MPDDWEDYFRNYFEDAQTTTVNTNIPRADLEPGFTIELQEQGEELSLQQLYERCADTIVAITGTVEDESGYYWGTGVIASPDGLIVTNAHIIDGCDSAKVTLYNDESYEAKLVGVDGISDLALLKIDAEGLPAAVFGDVSSIAVGDEVAAIGNPLGEDFRSTLTNGIISAIDRGLNYNGRTMSLLQTNTAINQGNSGGALFNMYGQVVGITNMKMMSYYSSIEGIGFAIPSSTVKSVVDSLAANGEVRGRPSIGITVGAIPEDVSSHYDIPSGLYVSGVQENSDAQLKGVQVGDILTAVNGQEVYTTEDVAAIKDALAVGDTMTLSLWRDGETIEVEIELMDTNDLY
ncbi:MAG: trypsin-like peptidase domain-containing protein [Oscillospiraceae bacterium]